MRATGLRGNQDDAYVLRCQPLGEQDRIVVMLTREHGRVDGVARGARRLRSRFAGRLEPLNQVRVAWRARQGRDLAQIDSLELVGSAYSWLVRPANFEAFTEIVHLVQAVSLPGDASPPLYRLLDALVAAAPEASDEPLGLARLKAYAALWVCRLEGLWPDISRCRACQAALMAKRWVGAASQGALCAGCGRGGRGMTLLTAGAAGLVAEMLAGAPRAVLAGARGGAPELEAVERLALSLLSYHLERDFGASRVSL